MYIICTYDFINSNNNTFYEFTTFKNYLHEFAEFFLRSKTKSLHPKIPKLLKCFKLKLTNLRNLKFVLFNSGKKLSF